MKTKKKYEAYTIYDYLRILPYLDKIDEISMKKGILRKIKPYAFTLFVKRYGEDKLLECLEANEKKGIVYHRQGVYGDYDDFDDVEKLIDFIMTGKD